MRTHAVLVLLAATAACSSPASDPRVERSLDPSTAARKAADDPAVTRADALLEDLKRREAEQQDFDRKNPIPAITPVLPTAAAPPPAASAGPAATTAAAEPPMDPAVATERAAANEKHDYEWWQQQSR